MLNCFASLIMIPVECVVASKNKGRIEALNMSLIFEIVSIMGDLPP